MKRWQCGSGSISVHQGDIVEQKANALVTAANSGLQGGGGVDGAIHRACGSELLKACHSLGGCSTGSAVITRAFHLEKEGVRYIIHAVGPIWRGGSMNEEKLLKKAYQASLKLAEEASCTSIAFPSISTGVYGFPIEKAAPIALKTASQFLKEKSSSLKKILFVLFNAEAYSYFEEELTRLAKRRA
jgi:O-acetyl-ADP-ribose deacetylase (regulator of RNase III)